MDSLTLWNRKWHLHNNKSVNSSGSDVPDVLAEIFHGYEAHQVKKIIMSNGSMRVLDIGAGMGRWSLFFAQMAEKVVALEPSTIAYNLLKTNTSNHSNIECLNVNFQNFKEKDKYELVILSGVLMYVTDQDEFEQFLSKALSMVSPGGYFILREPLGRRQNFQYKYPGKTKSSPDHYERKVVSISRTEKFYKTYCSQRDFDLIKVFPGHTTVFYHVKIPFESIKRYYEKMILFVFNPNNMALWFFYNRLFGYTEKKLRYLIDIPKINILIFKKNKIRGISQI